MYEFLDYCNTKDIETAWLLDKESVIEEVKKQYQTDKFTLNFLYSYWQEKISSSWHRYGLLQWCLRSAGKFNDNCDNPKFLAERCVNHLDQCLHNSFDNCDFQEKWYGQQKALDSMCILCFKTTKGSSSEVHCARCYRDILNKWRPL